MKFSILKKAIPHWSVATLLFLLLNESEAQDAASSGFNYSVISWEGSIKNELYRQDGSTYVTINLYSTSRTEWLWHQGREPIILYTKETNQDGSHHYIPAAKAFVPEQIRRALLIVTKDKKTNSFDILVVNDNTDLCPLGSYRFLNWTDKKIAGKLGDETFVLEPKNAKTIQPDITNDKNLSIQLVELSDSENQRLYHSRWSLQSRTRKLVLLVPRNQQGQSPVRIKIIADYGPPT